MCERWDVDREHVMYRFVSWNNLKEQADATVLCKWGICRLLEALRLLSDLLVAQRTHPETTLCDAFDGLEFVVRASFE